MQPNKCIESPHIPSHENTQKMLDDMKAKSNAPRHTGDNDLQNIKLPPLLYPTSNKTAKETENECWCNWPSSPWHLVAWPNAGCWLEICNDWRFELSNCQMSRICPHVLYIETQNIDKPNKCLTITAGVLWKMLMWMPSASCCPMFLWICQVVLPMKWVNITRNAKWYLHPNAKLSTNAMTGTLKRRKTTRFSGMLCLWMGFQLCKPLLVVHWHGCRCLKFPSRWK